MFTYLREAFEFYRETVQQALGVYRGADHKGVTVTEPTATPKPGPHLHREPEHRTFRTRAVQHALAASEFMEVAERAKSVDEREGLALMAYAEATVSLACSHIAPPARAFRRRIEAPLPESARGPLAELRDQIAGES